MIPVHSGFPVEIADIFYIGHVECESCGNGETIMWPGLIEGGFMNFECSACGMNASQLVGPAMAIAPDGHERAAWLACIDAIKAAQDAELHQLMRRKVN